MASKSSYIDYVKEIERQDLIGATDTAFLTAVKNGNIDKMRWCLNRKVSVDAQDIDGRTGLHHAASIGNEDVLIFLLNYGANAEIKTKDGTTLHYAVANNRLKVAKYLLDWGLSVDALDSDECTPIMIASIRGHADMVVALLDSKANIEVLIDVEFYLLR